MLCPTVVWLLLQSAKFVFRTLFFFCCCRCRARPLQRVIMPGKKFRKGKGSKKKASNKQVKGKSKKQNKQPTHTLKDYYPTLPAPLKRPSQDDQETEDVSCKKRTFTEQGLQPGDARTETGEHSSSQLDGIDTSDGGIEPMDTASAEPILTNCITATTTNTTTTTTTHGPIAASFEREGMAEVTPKDVVASSVPAFCHDGEPQAMCLSMQEAHDTGQEVNGTKQKVNGSGQEVKGTGQEVKGTGQEVKATGQEVKATGQEVKGSGRSGMKHVDSSIDSFEAAHGTCKKTVPAAAAVKIDTTTTSRNNNIKSLSPKDIEHKCLLENCNKPTPLKDGRTHHKYCCLEHFNKGQRLRRITSEETIVAESDEFFVGEALLIDSEANSVVEEANFSNHDNDGKPYKRSKEAPPNSLVRGSSQVQSGQVARKNAVQPRTKGTLLQSQSPQAFYKESSTPTIANESTVQKSKPVNPQGASGKKQSTYGKQAKTDGKQEGTYGKPKPSHPASSFESRTLRSSTRKQSNSQGPIHFYHRSQDYFEFTNFYPARIVVGGEEWPTSEHYFQGQKYIGTPLYHGMRKCHTPREAFALSRSPTGTAWRRSDWERVKLDVMYVALFAKFTQDKNLERLLLSTGQQELVEHTNTDSFWGDGGDGSGENHLGKLLMKLRKKLSLRPK